MANASGWATLPGRLALPSVYHEVAEVIGWDRAIDLGCYVAESKRAPSRRKAGSRHSKSGTLYVAHDFDCRGMQGVASVIGQDATEKLARAFGGELLEFCGVEKAFIEQRNKAIAERFAYGYSAREVALSFGMTERQIRRICQGESGTLTSNAAAARHLRCARLAGVRDAVLRAADCGGSIEVAAREWGFAPDVAHAIVCKRG